MHARAAHRALAALLALVSMQDDNTAQDAIRSNIEVSDLCAFFQGRRRGSSMLERESEVLKIEREGATPRSRRL